MARTNTSSYITAGIAGGESFRKNLAAAVATTPDFTGISNTIVDARAAKEKALINAKAKTDVAKIGADNLVEVTKIKNDTIEKNKPRMAGKLMALGAQGLGGYLTGNQLKKGMNEKYDSSITDTAMEALETRLETQRTKLATARAELAKATGMSTTVDDPSSLPGYIDMSKYGSSGKTDSTSDSGKDDGGTGTTGTPTVTGVGKYDLSSLTDKDWTTLSRVVSGEQGPGKDRYGIVASVLNRVQSKDFPNTIQEVAYQNDGKGTYQYEAFTKGTDFADSKLTADLKSDSGRQEILKALKVLDGRTDFKGQTMLNYRSSKGNKDYDGDGKPDLDPMFDPKGNFYHYSWQTNG